MHIPHGLISLQNLDGKENGYEEVSRFCYRRMLNVTGMMRATNVEIRRRLNIKVNIMLCITKRKLGLLGHICRKDNSGKIKV